MLAVVVLCGKLYLDFYSLFEGFPIYDNPKKLYIKKSVSVADTGQRQKLGL
jgi:hypothetical protein